MATYSIIVNRGNENKATVEFEGTEQQAIEKMLALYAYHFDDQFFPNEEKTQVIDCDGEVTWNTGEKYIGAGERHAFIELQK